MTINITINPFKGNHYGKICPCFSKDEAVVHYYNEKESFPSLIPSMQRTNLEKAFLRKPHTELERNLISSWKKNDIFIVLGKLGRQPSLLNYYLDLLCQREAVNLCKLSNNNSPVLSRDNYLSSKMRLRDLN